VRQRPRPPSEELRNKGETVLTGYHHVPALVAVDRRLLFACRKLHLPNEGVFEERQFFSPGK